MRKNLQQKECSLIYDACIHLRLASDFEIINKKIDFMAEISSEDFLPLNQKLRMYQKSLDELIANNKIDKKIFAASAYNSIAEIIRDMQFHDIIQQRLDHIRRINQAIIEELRAVDYNPLYLEKTNYVKIITLLSKINFVQIQVICYEYRSVIENLKKSLSTINEFVNIEPSHSQIYYFSNVSLFNVLTETICTKLKNISETICPKNKESSLSENIDYVKNIYTMNAERDIFTRVKELSEKEMDIDTINTIIQKLMKESVNDNKYELF